MIVKVQIIAAFTLLLIYQLNATDTDAPIVKTVSGQVKGSLMNTRLGKIIYSFRGIYYAEAPIGEKRFKVDLINKLLLMEQLNICSKFFQISQYNFRRKNVIE